MEIIFTVLKILFLGLLCLFILVGLWGYVILPIIWKDTDRMIDKALGIKKDKGKNEN